MLRLSKLTDYAIVILAEMDAGGGELLSAATLAQYTGIPEPTVAKILKILVRGGLVNSVRGAGGGYRLDRKANDLKIGRIIEVMEGPVALTSCVEGSGEACALEGNCRTQARWNPVNRAIKAALANISLADMVSPAVVAEQTGEMEIAGATGS